MHLIVIGNDAGADDGQLEPEPKSGNKGMEEPKSKDDGTESKGASEDASARGEQEKAKHAGADDGQLEPEPKSGNKGVEEPKSKDDGTESKGASEDASARGEQEKLESGNEPLGEELQNLHGNEKLKKANPGNKTQQQAGWTWSLSSQTRPGTIPFPVP